MSGPIDVGLHWTSSDPGKPVENGHIESFNGKLRDECLNAHQFLSIDDASCKIEAWRMDYNLHRPHSALRQLSPAEFLKRRSNEDEEAALVLI
jgi:putative transposase